MRRVLVSTGILCWAGLLGFPPQAGAVAKEIIQLQRDVSLLQQQLQTLQQTVDQNQAVMKTLLEQSLDAVNRMQQTASDLEKSVQESQAHTSGRLSWG